MNNYLTEQNNVSKLSLQVESLEEGFLKLSGSTSLKDMAARFSKILKNNFVSDEIYMLQKSSVSGIWEPMNGESIDEASVIAYLDQSDYANISSFPDLGIVAAVALPLSDSSSLGIIIKQKPGEIDFSEIDRVVLKILLQVFDSAYKSFMNQKKEKKLVFDLNEKVFQLNNLVDAAIELSRFEKRNVLYKLALERLSTVTNAASSLLKISSFRGEQDVYYTFPENIEPESIISNKFCIQSTFTYKGRDYTFILSEKEKRGGATAFTELDQVLLDAIKRQVSASIENDDLHKQSIEKELIEKELGVASSIQKQIIPETLPKLEGYEIAGTNIPSKEVGGDYFDCIHLNDGRYALIIADVAGKGISAALLVNTLNAALYSYLEFNLPLTELSFKLNKLIYRASPPDKFITFFIAVLDPATGKLDIVNAGHNPILLLKKDGSVRKIQAGGIGLGMLDFDLEYTGENLEMDRGDMLFLYTDGIPEAMNISDEEYSEERMEAFLSEHSSKPSQQFVSELVEDIKSYAGGAPQSDDITTLVIKRI